MGSIATARENGDFLSIQRGGEGVVKRRDDVEPQRYGINWNAVGVILAGVIAIAGLGLWVISMSLAPIQYRLDGIEKRLEKIEK